MMKAKKRLIRTLGIILALGLVWLIIFLCPRYQSYKGNNPLMQRDEKPLAFAHRGGSDEFPENTLEAYYNAVSISPDIVLETDVRLTKDGVLILLHDGTLDSTCNVQGNIADWNYTDLISQRIDFGYDNDTEGGILVGELEKFTDDNGNEKRPTDVTYPEGITARDEEIFLVTTFEELLTAFPDNFISVEIKDEERGVETLHELIRVIDRHDAFDRVLVASFISEVTGECKKMIKRGDAPENLLYTVSFPSSIVFCVLEFFGLDALYFTSGAAIHLPMDEFGYNLATERIIAAAHRHNLAIHYWTIDDRDEMEELISVGADGIMSDEPTELVEVLKERK